MELLDGIKFEMEDAVKNIKMISPYAKVVQFVEVSIEHRGGFG